MKSPGGKSFNIGRALTLTLALLIVLILVGNGLVILQFERARLQTDRLTGVSHQLIAVLRLQESLLSFHQQLNELVQSRDARRLAAAAQTLRTDLLEQTQQTRRTPAYLPPEFRVDPAFLTAVDAVETTLPLQLQEITALATIGDWEAVRLRLDNESKWMETTASALVKSIDRDLDEELPRAVANMTDVQHGIFLIVPATAISTALIAAFFGWAITRRIVGLRIEERVGERTRIARELHDNLLQGAISANMLLHVVVDQLPADSPSRLQLTRVTKLMEHVIDEGRDTIRAFRSGISEAQDLPRAFSTVQEELGLKERIDYRVIVEGPPEVLSPSIRSDVYSIGREALVNSFRHSGASRIELELQYSAGHLRVVVRDDGCGITSQMLQAGRDGHWGLSGMRERAERIGAEFKVLSRAGGGTEVELVVPGSIAFESHGSSSMIKRLTGLWNSPTDE